VTTEHRKAPRRKIVSVKRTGRWGQYQHEHRLSCGHVELRPRKASTPTLACAWCYRAARMQIELSSLGKNEQQQLDEGDDPTVESRISQIRASIAARFSVPLEAVDIVSSIATGEVVVSYATVFLSQNDIRRISE